MPSFKDVIPMSRIQKAVRPARIYLLRFDSMDI